MGKIRGGRRGGGAKGPGGDLLIGAWDGAQLVKVKLWVRQGLVYVLGGGGGGGGR